MKAVPVEHRVLGLDRRKMVGTLAVLALVILWAVVAPFVDDSIHYENEVASGETFDVGSGVTIVPPTRWEVDPQTALTQGSLVVHNGGLTVTVTVGTFDGELSDLMASANESLDIDRITRPQSSITTTQGSTGLIESFDAVNSHGTLSVFAEDGVGVEIESLGPEPLATKYADEINAMVISLQFGASS
ncbi:MAG: hypothetical protein DRJ50_05125 [Actinobacteria bacterium]|nr:MAG: hypothetical protein DRJ50_05125 [Actinomycetota bacterium]